MEPKTQILSVLVENSAGVLSQVSRMFSRKGYNIESLAVGTTEVETVSRMTIIVETTDEMVTQIANQLNKLLPVIAVQVMDAGSSVRRELILVKVKADSRDSRDEILQIVNIFRAKVIDVAKESLTIEITGDHSKSSAMLKLLETFGILELVRTGAVALERGCATIHQQD